MRAALRFQPIRGEKPDEDECDAVSDYRAGLVRPEKGQPVSRHLIVWIPPPGGITMCQVSLY